jgi:hypothetical protein
MRRRTRMTEASMSICSYLDQHGLCRSGLADTICRLVIVPHELHSTSSTPFPRGLETVSRLPHDGHSKNANAPSGSGPRHPAGHQYVPQTQIHLGDPILSAADADEPSEAPWAARRIVSSVCIHDLSFRAGVQDRFRPFAGRSDGVPRVFDGTRLPIDRARVTRTRGVASICVGDSRGEAWTNFPSRRFMMTEPPKNTWRFHCSRPRMSRAVGPQLISTSSVDRRGRSFCHSGHPDRTSRGCRASSTSTSARTALWKKPGHGRKIG